VAATLGHYADDFVHGSHDLKFGVQIVPRRDDVFSSLVINNIFYYDLNGARITRSSGNHWHWPAEKGRKVRSRRTTGR